MEVQMFDRNFVMDDVLGDESKIVVNEPYKIHRWWADFLLIFSHNGCLWQTIYHKPIGGDNEDLPFVYEDTMECVRVWGRVVPSVEYITEDPANMIIPNELSAKIDHQQ